LQRGSSNEKLLHDRLQNLIASLGEKEVSKTLFIEGKPYVVRILEIRQLTARPLHEVSAEIRRELAPVKLKTTIKTLSDELKKTANVQYATLNKTGN
jgi:hypothetical protein